MNEQDPKEDQNPFQNKLRKLIADIKKFYDKRRHTLNWLLAIILLLFGFKKFIYNNFVPIS